MEVIMYEVLYACKAWFLLPKTVCYTRYSI